MRSLSEQIVHCVTLAGDGRYSNSQIANLVGQSEEWVEQVLAAWEYRPKAYLHQAAHLFVRHGGPTWNG